MTRQELISLIRTRKSFLCVGLDTDLAKIPDHLRGKKDAAFFFNRAIIDATIDLCAAYKPNLAFYEAMGLDGMHQLKMTLDYLHQLGKPAFVIADAKRGDIGNTSERYARAYLDPEGDFGFDAITVAPYMGEDSVVPFTIFPDRWVALLALTSNKGAADFQMFHEKQTGKTLFESVLSTSKNWGTPDNMMYVVGATRAEMLKEVRAVVPDNFLLVPGVGAQGGSLEEVCRYGMNKDCGLLVNSSRGIIYASRGTDFAEAARHEAEKLQAVMQTYLK
ncbi:MAG: orotidine-5'-phosphate decarboxylase [Bacteroidales bacterium]|nr:orotidine-5'-phosphate decarboxylase [Bacteroidales bacterium]